MSVHPSDLVRLALAGALASQLVFQLALARDRRDPRFLFSAAWCLVGALALAARFAMRSSVDPGDAVWWTRISAAAFLALLPITLAALRSLIDEPPPWWSTAVLIASLVPIALALASDAFLRDQAVRGRDLLGSEFWIAERGPLFAAVYVVVPLGLAECARLVLRGGALGGGAAGWAFGIAVAIAALLGLVGTALVRAGYPSPQLFDLGVPAGAWAFAYAFNRYEDRRRRRLVEVGERRRQFIAASLQAQEREREHISSQLNDTLGQSMSDLVVEVQAIERLDPPLARARVRDLRETARGMLDEVRRTARQLHPAALTDLGFEQALDSSVHENAAAHDVEVDVHVRYPEPRLPRLVELALYRMAQESVTALLATGEPTSLSVMVEVDRARARLVLESDASDESSTACKSLVDFAGDRIGVLGGSIELETSAEGTAIFVTLPSEFDLSTTDPLPFEASSPRSIGGSKQTTNR